MLDREQEALLNGLKETDVPRHNLLKGWRPYVILILLGCLFYIPGLTNLPPTDRDEARFAQASRQMLETSNYVDIRFQDKPRYKKPIGIYWLQAACAGLTVGIRPAIWAYRLPSFSGALLSVLLTFYFGASFFNRKTGLMAAVLLESCLLLNVEAHIATTDAMLLAAVVAAQGLLGRAYLRRRAGVPSGMGNALFFWAACGAGILLKGPVPLAVAGLTAGTLVFTDKDPGFIRQLHPVKGALLMLAIVLPWFAAISLATGGAFVRKAFISDLLPKLIGGHESHGAPPGTYTILFPLLFWPASLFAVTALWSGWKSRALPQIKFLFAWILPSWVMFELVPTKLPHYILPLFPAVALLTAAVLTDTVAGGDPVRAGKWARYLFRGSKGIFTGIAVVIGVGLAALPPVFNHAFNGFSLLPLAGAAGIIMLIVRPGRLKKSTVAISGCLIGSLLLIVPAFSLILPSLNGVWISRDVARIVARLPHRVPRELVSVGYHEPSLVFLLGTKTRLVDTPEDAVKALQQGASLALIEETERQRFETIARAGGVTLVPVTTLRGFNYSKGKWLRLTLFRTSYSNRS